MVPLNLFLHDKRDLMQNYFSKLIDVEDLDHKIEVDSLLNANRNVDRVFQTSLNQIFLIHRLLKENLSLFKDPNDPILPILIKLAEVPAKVKHKENHPVTLRVHNPNVKSEEFNEKSTQTLGKQNNLLSLLSMEQHPSADEACKTLLTLAKTVKASSIDYKELIQQHKRDFQGFLEKVIEMNNEHSELAANTYNRVNVAVEEISKSENKDISFSRFVSSYVSNIKTLHKRAKQLHQHVDNVQKALVSIRTRHDHLEEKLDTFRIYLQNVEKGGEKTKKKPKKKKKKKDVVTEATFAHEDLEKDGVILWVHEDHRSHTRFLIYTFKRVDRGVYEIWVHAKAFIASMYVFDEPIKLTMLELLEMENKLQNQFRLRGLITLNVNLLKRLLTKTFRDY